MIGGISMKKFSWKMYMFVSRYITGSIIFFCNFLNTLMWQYAHYKYGAGSHIGDCGSFIKNVKFSWKSVKSELYE